MAKHRLHVEGLENTGDMERLRRRLLAIPGVQSVSADLLTRQFRVEGPGHLPLLGLLETVHAAGFWADPLPAEELFPDLNAERSLARRGTLRAALLCLPPLLVDLLALPVFPLLAALWNLLALFLLFPPLFSPAFTSRGKPVPGLLLLRFFGLLLLFPASILGEGMASLPTLALLILVLSRNLEKAMIAVIRSLEPRSPEGLSELFARKPEEQEELERLSIHAPLVLMGASLISASIAWTRGLPLPGILMSAAAPLFLLSPRSLGLVLSPTLLVAALLAMRRGAWIRDLPGFASLSSVRRIAFDRLGVLGQGKARVERMELLGKEPSEKVCALVSASLEEAEHPYLKAIADFASRRSEGGAKVLSVLRSPGAGLRAEVAGRTLLLGYDWFLVKEGVLLEEASREALEDASLSPVYLALDGDLAAVFGIADEDSPEMPGLLRRLRRKGVESLLLSGEAPHVIEAIGKRAGLGLSRGGLSPDERARVLLEGEGLSLALGTGSPDAALLAAANLAMSIGSEESISGKLDARIPSGNLSLLHDLLSLSRYALSILRLHRRLLFLFPAILLPLALAGIASPLFLLFFAELLPLLFLLGALRLQTFSFESVRKTSD
ncbi:MAG: HAD family hydrolase [Candidatus Krumholzibacteria bacterium]|jgi:P-type E1-E2 ATPase|nr:HAD family hydrolase [Candidatus Krumholzibacteria bacterium]MDP7022121.1 HAD family hydrolase [Candidatus Krumholzibacteria bacterium]